LIATLAPSNGLRNNELSSVSHYGQYLRDFAGSCRGDTT
jgi:hypothetical protein